MLERIIEKLSGVTPNRFFLALQDDGDVSLAVPLGGCDEAVAGFSGVAGLDADGAAIAGEQFIGILDCPLPAFAPPPVSSFADDFTELRILQSGFGD